MSALAFASAPVGNVLLNLWQRGAMRADVEALERDIEQLARATGEPVVVLMVIPENTSLPNDEARRTAGEVLRRATISRVVVVIEGRGFGPGAMRSVFVGLSLIYTPGFTWSVKVGLDEAVDWLELQLQTTLDRDGLRQADRQLRDQLDIAMPAPSTSGRFRRAR